ncbi:helix-turn-helix domain-containing protein [Solemya velum gill symbiont]|nr:helix-turn-helix domain-containing protein [Solemya velum gill symbiont]
MNVSSTLEDQRKSIYERLAEGNALSTLFAREELGIMHPAARIMELRQRGHNIITNWQTETDVTGKSHRIAKYILLHKKEEP